MLNEQKRSVAFGGALDTYVKVTKLVSAFVEAEHHQHFKS